MSSDKLISMPRLYTKISRKTVGEVRLEVKRKNGEPSFPLPSYTC